MNADLKKRIWWNYIGEDLQGLLAESTTLLEKVPEWEKNLADGHSKISDYSFIVFPAAKAFEGFLKKVFLQLGFISQDDYYGQRFRIGKALNPSLDKHLRAAESVYDKISDYCQESRLADQLWETWKMSRNLIFHWFPNEKNIISFDEAKERYLKILTAMDETFRGCKIK